MVYSSMFTRTANVYAKRLELQRHLFGWTKTEVRQESNVGWPQCLKVLSGEWEGLNWNTICKVIQALKLTPDEVLIDASAEVAPMSETYSRNELLSDSEMTGVKVPLYPNLAEAVSTMEDASKQLPNTVEVRVLCSIRSLPGRKFLIPAPGSRLSPAVRQQDLILLWHDPAVGCVKNLADDTGVAVLTKAGKEYIGYGSWDFESEKLVITYGLSAFPEDQIRFSEICWLALIKQICLMKCHKGGEDEEKQG